MFVNISGRVTGALITVIYAVVVVLATSHFLRCARVHTPVIRVIGAGFPSSGFYASDNMRIRGIRYTVFWTFPEKYGTVNLYDCPRFLFFLFPHSWLEENSIVRINIDTRISHGLKKHSSVIRWKSQQIIGIYDYLSVADREYYLNGPPLIGYQRWNQFPAVIHANW